MRCRNQHQCRWLGRVDRAVVNRRLAFECARPDAAACCATNRRQRKVHHGVEQSGLRERHRNGQHATIVAVRSETHIAVKSRTFARRCWALAVFGVSHFHRRVYLTSEAIVAKRQRFILPTLADWSGKETEIVGSQINRPVEPNFDFKLLRPREVSRGGGFDVDSLGRRGGAQRQECARRYNEPHETPPYKVKVSDTPTIVGRCGGVNRIPCAPSPLAGPLRRSGAARSYQEAQG